MATVLLRPALPQDRAYLLSATRNTLVQNSAYCSGMHPAAMAVLLEPIFAVYSTVVAVADGDGDTILGFVTFRSPTEVAFVYVRERFRGHGIARGLLDYAGIKRGEIYCALMVTKLAGASFAKSAQLKGYRLLFRPYIPLEISAGVIVGAK